MTCAAQIYAECTVFEAVYQRHQVPQVCMQIAALTLTLNLTRSTI